MTPHQAKFLLTAAQRVQAELARLHDETGASPISTEAEGALVDAIRAAGGKLYQSPPKG